MSSVNLRGNVGDEGFRTGKLREYSSGSETRSSRLTRMRMAGISGTQKLLAWLVNYNTVESILLFSSVRNAWRHNVFV